MTDARALSFLLGAQGELDKQLHVTFSVHLGSALSRSLSSLFNVPVQAQMVKTKVKKSQRKAVSEVLVSMLAWMVGHQRVHGKHALCQTRVAFRICCTKVNRSHSIPLHSQTDPGVAEAAVNDSILP